MANLAGKVMLRDLASLFAAVILIKTDSQMNSKYNVNTKKRKPSKNRLIFQIGTSVLYESHSFH